VTLDDLPSRVRELESFALRSLPKMRRPDGVFCHEVRMPRLEPSGRSLRYTLMCALGLERARRNGFDVPVDPDELVGSVAAESQFPELTLGDLGLLLWADARLGGARRDETMALVDRRIGSDIPDLEGLELSWLLIGAAESGSEPLFERALSRQLERVDSRSGLLRHRDSGLRSRLPNFATQIYGVLAMAISARHGQGHALASAERLADRLIELQNPDGGWPWIFDTASGNVVEPFEIYSVHQDAMAPMALLELSEVSGQSRFRDAAYRGLQWVFGKNAIGQSMLKREVGILHRSIRRRKGFDRVLLYVNTAGALLGRAPFREFDGPLELNPTDRPYHLGWVLEAWAGREPI
jgi:hypothetical protein